MALPAAMALVGLMKGELIDKPKEERQRELAAKTQQWSPWTGLRAQPYELADPFGQAFQYGGTGLAMDQSMQNNEAMRNYLNSNKSYIGSMPGAQGSTGHDAEVMQQLEQPPPKSKSIPMASNGNKWGGLSTMGMYDTSGLYPGGTWWTGSPYDNKLG